MGPIRFSLAGMFIAVAILAFFLAFLAPLVWTFLAISTVLLVLIAIQWPITWLLGSRNKTESDELLQPQSGDM
jgi:hypothetical protein